MHNSYANDSGPWHLASHVLGNANHVMTSPTSNEQSTIEQDRNHSRLNTQQPPDISGHETYQPKVQCGTRSEQIPDMLWNFV
jgi:hypothetical protein